MKYAEAIEFHCSFIYYSDTTNAKLLNKNSPLNKSVRTLLTREGNNQTTY